MRVIPLVPSNSLALTIAVALTACHGHHKAPPASSDARRAEAGIVLDAGNVGDAGATPSVDDSHRMGAGVNNVIVPGMLLMNPAAGIGSGTIIRTFDNGGGGWKLWNTIDPTDPGTAAFSSVFETGPNTPLGVGFDHTGTPICWNQGRVDSTQPGICRGDIESHWANNTELYDTTTTTDGQEHRWLGSTQAWNGTTATTFLYGVTVLLGDWNGGGGATVQLTNSTTPTSTASTLQLGGLVAGYVGTNLEVESNQTSGTLFGVGTTTQPQQYIGLTPAGMIVTATQYGGSVLSANMAASGQDAIFSVSTHDGRTAYLTQRSGGESEVQASAGNLALFAAASSDILIEPSDALTYDFGRNSASFYNTSSSIVMQFVSATPTLELASSGLSTWSSTSLATGTADTGIARHAAGVVEIDNGTAGTLEGLIAGNITVQTGTGQAALFITPRAASTDGDNLCIGGGCQSVAYNSGIGSHTGSTQTALGIGALQNVTTAADNVAIGSFAMQSDTDGGLNVGIGEQSLVNANHYGYTTCVGAGTCENLTEGDNTGIGEAALLNDTSGGSNVAVGVQALEGAVGATPQFDVAVGLGANQAVTTGVANVMVGYNAGVVASSAGGDTCLGDQSCLALTSGFYNVMVGNGAGITEQSGTQNIFIGQNTGNGMVTGNYNVVIGSRLNSFSDVSGYVVIGDGNGNIRFQADASGNVTHIYTLTVQTGTGQAALFATTRAASTDGDNLCIGGGCQSVAYDGTHSHTGSTETAFGISSLNADTTGADNSAFGAFALGSNTAGQLNAAGGYEALYSNTVGAYNTAFGAAAMESMVADVDNTCVGEYCMGQIGSGSENAAFGVQALEGGSANTSTIDNTAIGFAAEQAITTGFKNTAIGWQSDYVDQSGIATVAVGAFAMSAHTDGDADTCVGGTCFGALSNGTNDTCIGGLCGSNATSGTDNVFVGYESGGGVVAGSYNTFVGANIGGLGDVSSYVVIGDGSGHIKIEDNGTVTSFIDPVTLGTAGDYIQLIQQTGTATAPKVYAYAGNPNGVISCTKGDITVDTSTPAEWQCSSGTTWNQVGAGVPDAETFGNGQDGTVTFNGTSTVLGLSPSSSIYTLTRDLYTNGVTVNSGVEIRTAGWRWFDNGAAGSATNNGHVDDDGIGDNGRSSGWYGGTSGGGPAGFPGTAGTSSAHVLGAPFAASQGSAAGGTGGAFGTNGANGSGLFAGGGGGGAEDGGGSGGATTAFTSNSMQALPTLLEVGNSGNGTFTTTLTFGAGGGGGGGGTVGTTGNGGAGAGICYVHWRKVSGTGTFSANGAAGAAGTNTTNGSQSNGGGGGGGGGGIMDFVYETRTGSSLTVTASGGASGPAGSGPGAAGGNGGTGAPGFLYIKNLSGDGS
jgi:hypothetical protein